MIADVNGISHRGANARLVLLIDTCGASGSVALADLADPARDVVAETLPGRSASEQLLPAVQRLLASERVRLGELGAIAVVHGPGSFTGVRVGIAAVKGLSEALGVPVVAISRLAVLAAKSNAEKVLALLDAGRGEVYAGEYRGDICVAEALWSAAQVREHAQRTGAMLVACELAVQERLAGSGVLQVEELHARDALEIARRRIAESSFEDLVTLDANYVRRSDAELFTKAGAAAAAPAC